MTCRNPALVQRVPNAGGGTDLNDVTMFIFYTSFGGDYPAGNQVTIDGWAFEDLGGRPHTAAEGSAWRGAAVPGRMLWTAGAPYVVNSAEQHVNIHVTPPQPTPPPPRRHHPTAP